MLEGFLLLCWWWDSACLLVSSLFSNYGWGWWECDDRISTIGFCFFLATSRSLQFMGAILNDAYVLYDWLFMGLYFCIDRGGRGLSLLGYMSLLWVFHLLALLLCPYIYLYESLLYGVFDLLVRTPRGGVLPWWSRCTGCAVRSLVRILLLCRFEKSLSVRRHRT